MDPTDYTYMVSYRLPGMGPNCGNQTGTLAEVNAYADAHKAGWVSHSFFRYTPDPSGVSTMTEVTADGTVVPRA